MNQLTLIIISYNSQEVISRCLGPLLASNRFPSIIIDNDSTDGSARKLCEQFPNAEVIKLKQNIGYGRATNIGLHKTETPYAILLNPDLLAEPKAIAQLLAYAENATPQAAIFAPAVKQKDFSKDPPESISWISGSAMLFDMKKMEQIGMFDENIFLFSEETDLCRRTIDAGYEILLCHDIYMAHLKGQSSPPDPAVETMRNWHFGWSRAYYFTKHGLARGKKNTRRMCWTYSFKAYVALKKKKRKKYKARATGVRAFIKGKKSFCGDGRPQASPTLPPHQSNT